MKEKRSGNGNGNKFGTILKNNIMRKNRTVGAFSLFMMIFLSCTAQKQDIAKNNKCSGLYDTVFFKTNHRFPVDSFQNKYQERKISRLKDGRYIYKVYSGYSQDRQIFREYQEGLVDDKYNLEYIKRYDSLGRIISTSLRSSYGSNAIGTSTTYYYNSANDSVPKVKESIDYDRHYPICWRQALDIAKKRGMKLDDETKLSEPYTGNGDNGKKEWVVWRLNFHIAIDAYTGKIRKWTGDAITP